MMKEKIKNIISSSIEVKSMVLNDDVLLTTVQQVAEMMVSALKNGKRIMVAALQMPSILLRNFLADSIPTVGHFPQRPCIATHPTSQRLPMITVMTWFTPGLSKA